MGQVNKIIESFLEHYKLEYDFYHNLAKLVADQCERMVDENGIRAIVTFRAKRFKNLKEKIYQRHQTKKYQSEEDIREDVVDLSGVRIALYFPADRKRVKNFLKDAFFIVKKRTFPRVKNKKNKKETKCKFDGYHAKHYRIKLKSDTLEDRYKDCANNIVEIQVASVLMHAWSEVNHDLAYKPSSGKLSPQELSILDGLNGLVLTGEIFLEQLQIISQERVAQDGRQFVNQYELADFICKKLNKSDGGGIENIKIKEGRVSLLFNFLKEISFDTPDKISSFLEFLKENSEKRTIVEQIIDNILKENPNFYSIYHKLVYGEEEDNLETEKFIKNWIVLERYIRCLADLEGIPVMQFSKLIHKLPFKENLQAKLHELRKIRNVLVHGYAINVLKSSSVMMENVMNELNDVNSIHSKKAMEWARSGQLELPEK